MNDGGGESIQALEKSRLETNARYKCRPGRRTDYFNTGKRPSHLPYFGHYSPRDPDLHTSKPKIVTKEESWNPSEPR